MKIKSIISLICSLFIVNIAKSQCLAGFTPPSLLSYSLSSTCPQTTVDLTQAINPISIPFQCEVAWFNNNTQTGDPIDNFENVSTGTYYAYYYDFTNDCYSPASNPVFVETVSCDACTQSFLALNPIIIGGNAPTPVGNISGLVFIKADFKFPIGTTFDKAEVLIEPNVTISPANGAGTSNNYSNLYIYGSHFYTCDKPWEGIKLYATSNLIIDEAADIIDPKKSTSSFIEDAKIAVEVNYGLGIQTANGDPSRIIIKNTIFNRNQTSIKIHNLTFPDAWANNANPINIENNVFTCRDIEFTIGHNSWDNLNKVVNTPITGGSSAIWDSYEAPFFTDLTKNSDKTTRAYLKKQEGGYSLRKPKMGILLVNNSCQNPAICTTPQAITIGSSAIPTDGVGTNIFDNLNIGIRVNKSDVNIYNSVFQNLKELSNYGIFADGFASILENNAPSFFNYTINTKVPIPNFPKNRFYGVENGIFLAAISNASIENCYFASNLDIANANASTNYRGIIMRSNNFTDININNNELYNIKYPIEVNLLKLERNMQSANRLGKLNINNNNINNQIPNYTPPAGYTPPNGYVHLGINIVNTNFSTRASTTFQVLNNQINNVYNGINLSRLERSIPIVTNNEISLNEDNTLTPSAEQFAINVASGSGAKITENNITGVGWAENNEPNYRSLKLNSGIIVSTNPGTYVMCNDMEHCTNGVKFLGTSSGTGFYDNRMYPSNQIGFLLDNAIIGQQGFPNDPDDGFTSNNSWITTANQNGNWDKIKDSYTMFCRNSDPTLSEFVIQVNAPTGQNPIAGGGSASSNQAIGTFYNFNIGLISSSIINGNNINRQDWCSDINLNLRKRTTIDPFIANQIADSSIAIPNDEPLQRLEVMQQELYEQAMEEPIITLNEPSIQQFVSSKQLSGFASINLANYYNSINNMDGVQQVLDNWVSNPSNLEENFKLYYEWLVAMDSGTGIDTAEVFALANKCPVKNGNVVYAARNIYNYLTNTMNAFEDNCNGAASRGTPKSYEFIRLKQPTLKQPVAVNTAKLYPTIAKDQITIENKLGIQSISILNSLGQVITTNKYNTINHLQVSINNYPAGIYLVKITDAKAATSMLKFVKN